MIYMAPALTRLGSVAGITASDIKCSIGNDFGHKERWTHPNTSPWTHWTEVATGNQATPQELLSSGRCQWNSTIVHVDPVP